MGGGPWTMNRWMRLLAIVLAVVVLPVAYVGLVNVAVEHRSIQFQAVWSDPSFSGPWLFNGSQGVSGGVLISGGILAVKASSSVTPQGFAAAEWDRVPFGNFDQAPFLIVSIQTPGELVGVRIAVATPSMGWALVLAKTYPDAAWHTEIIDLRVFGFTGIAPSMSLQLGFIGVQQATAPGTSVEFQGVEIASATEVSG